MTDSPYQAPSPITSAGSEPERPTREELAAVIRSWLNDELTAFEFDEKLDRFHDAEDPVIEYVADTVWNFYDDCQDHRVCLTKAEWNYFQRLLLLLASNCQIERKYGCRWSWTQLTAAMSLAAFPGVAFRTGWGLHLYALAVPFGVISIVLSRLGPKPEPPLDPLEPIIAPFNSIGDLETAYRSSGFRKARYPVMLSGRKIRSEVMERLHWIQFWLTWMLFSPAVLFCQMLPERTVRQTAKVP